MYKIFDIIKKELKQNDELTTRDFLINVTGGTKLMVSAAATAAYIARTRAYYVHDKREVKRDQYAVELPIPIMPKPNSTQKRQQEVLKSIATYGKITNSQLKEKLKMNAKNLTYHIRQLSEKKLITVERGVARTKTISGGINGQRGYKKEIVDMKQIMIKITPAGRLQDRYPIIE